MGGGSSTPASTPGEANPLNSNGLFEDRGSAVKWWTEHHHSNERVPVEDARPVLQKFLTHQLKRKPTDKEVSSLLHKLDPNGDGEVTMTEFVKATTKKKLPKAEEFESEEDSMAQAVEEAQWDPDEEDTGKKQKKHKKISAADQAAADALHQADEEADAEIAENHNAVQSKPELEVRLKPRHVPTPGPNAHTKEEARQLQQELAAAREVEELQAANAEAKYQADQAQQAAASEIAEKNKRILALIDENDAMKKKFDAMAAVAPINENDLAGMRSDELRAALRQNASGLRAEKEKNKLLEANFTRQTKSLEDLKTEWKRMDAEKGKLEDLRHQQEAKKNSYKNTVQAQQAHIVKLRLLLERALARRADDVNPLQDELNSVNDQLEEERKESTRLRRELSALKFDFQYKKEKFGKTAMLETKMQGDLKLKELTVELIRAKDAAAAFETTVTEQQQQINGLQKLLETYVLPNGEPRGKQHMNLRDRLFATEQELEELRATSAEQLKQLEVLRVTTEAQFSSELASAQNRIAELEQTLADIGLTSGNNGGNDMQRPERSSSELALMGAVVSLRQELWEAREARTQMEARVAAVTEGKGPFAAGPTSVDTSNQSGVLYWMTLYYASQERCHALTNEITETARRFAKDLAGLRAQLLEKDLQLASSIGKSKADSRRQSSGRALSHSQSMGVLSPTTPPDRAQLNSYGLNPQNYGGAVSPAGYSSDGLRSLDRDRSIDANRQRDRDRDRRSY